MCVCVSRTHSFAIAYAQTDKILSKYYMNGTYSHVVIVVVVVDETKKRFFVASFRSKPIKHNKLYRTVSIVHKIQFFILV